MPKRTNLFQRVIFAIQCSVAGSATVTESKTFPSHVPGTTQEREVDIVIESELAGHSVVVGVECTSTTRPVDAMWVERLVQKHEQLPTDKLVLVSEAGYTHDALATAKHYGVEALSLDEAVTVDWTTIAGGKLERGYIAAPMVAVTRCWITYVNEQDNQPDAHPTVGENSILYDSEGHVQPRLFEKGMESMDVRELLTLFPEAGDYTFTREMRAPGWFLMDDLGQRHEVDKILYHYALHNEPRSPMDLKHRSYKDSQVAYGTFDHVGIGEGVLFTIVEREDKPAVSVLLAPPSKKPASKKSSVK